MNNLIIDSHSHIGNDFFQGKSTIDEYIDFARHNGINVLEILIELNYGRNFSKKIK